MPPNLEGQPPVIAEGLYSFQIGGSERVGVNLAREFRARGYRPICFAFYDSDGPMRAELEAHGIPCIDMNYTLRNRLVRRVSFQWEFYRFLRQFQVRALHVHHATALTICGAAARLAGVGSVVMTEHAIHQFQQQPRYRRMATRDCRYATEITAVHSGIVDYFRDELQVPQDRLHIVPNGVRIQGRPPHQRQRLRAELGLAQECFAFLFAGRLEPVKDVSTLLRAFASIPRPLRAHAHLLVAGSGSQHDVLQAAAAELGIGDRVRLLGARTDIPDLLSAADAFVMSSVSEGLPMALIEAMAADVPCVATAVGGIPELFAGGCGVLVPASDPEALSLAMRRLMERPQATEQMVDNARRRVQSLYDLDQLVTRYLALLKLPSHWPPRGPQVP